MSNSGLLFHFSTGDDYVVVIYSGDINVPITSLMSPDDYPFVYDKPENVFIFHDMTSLEHEQNPHTNFMLLEPIKKQFNNLFTYHHGEEAVSKINKIVENKDRNELIIEKTIEAYDRFEKVLILVQQIDHGMNIMEELKKRKIKIVSRISWIVSRKENRSQEPEF